jgi:hypothetical protein
MSEAVAAYLPSRLAAAALAILRLKIGMIPTLVGYSIAGIGLSMSGVSL